MPISTLVIHLLDTASGAARIYEGYLADLYVAARRLHFSIGESEGRRSPISSFAEGIGAAIRANVRRLAQYANLRSDYSRRQRKEYLSIRESLLLERVNNQNVGALRFPRLASIRTTWKMRSLSARPQCSRQSWCITFASCSALKANQRSVTRGRESSFLTPLPVRAQADYLRTEYHAVLTEMLSYSTGKHLIKGGVNVPDLSRRGFNNNLNSAGTFYFSSCLTTRRAVLSPSCSNRETAYSFLEKTSGFCSGRISPAQESDALVWLALRLQNYFHDNNNFARASRLPMPREQSEAHFRAAPASSTIVPALVDSGYPAVQRIAPATIRDSESQLS